jgi:hypothetical protein
MASSWKSDEEEYHYAWHGVPDPQKRASMSPEDLAIELSKIEDSNSPPYILLSHELNLRLAKEQSKATYIGIVSGLAGVVLGAWLNSYFQQVPVVNCVYPASTSNETKNEAFNSPTPPRAGSAPEKPNKSAVDPNKTPGDATTKSGYGNNHP